MRCCKAQTAAALLTALLLTALLAASLLTGCAAKQAETELPATQPAATLLLPATPLPPETALTPATKLPVGPMMALTFDDGPSEYTDAILDVLEANGARATFFVVGQNLADWPDTVGRAVSLGCEIGSHTWAHENYTEADEAMLVRSLMAVRDEMKQTYGYEIRLFRPAGGEINDYICQSAAMMEYPVVIWSASSDDWISQDAAAITEACRSAEADGAIVLLHDLQPWTAEAMRDAVPMLISDGYRLVTVSELFAARQWAAAPGRVYPEP